MNNYNRNNSSNSNSNWYGELGDGDKDDIRSLHTISDDSISITTVQAQPIAEEAEVQQFKLEIEQELKILNTDIKQVNKQVNKVLSTLIDKDEDKLVFEEEDNDMTVLPTLKVEEEFQNKVVGVITRADIELFKDHISNVLATASHPHTIVEVVLIC